MLICTICGDVISTKREPVQMVTHMGNPNESIYNKTYVKDEVDLCYKCQKRLNEIRRHAVEDAELKMYNERVVNIKNNKVIVNKSVETEELGNTCPECGCEIDRNVRNCPKCGTFVLYMWV